MLNGGAISWCSRLQPTTALSATEAEYMAVSSAAQELTSLRYVLEAIAPSSVTDPTVIWEDNQGAIFIAENPVNGSSRLKHVHKQHHFIRDCIRNGTALIQFIPSGLQLADTLTKNLGRTAFVRARNSYLG